MKRGDVILGIGGNAFPGDADAALGLLKNVLVDMPPGASLKLNVLRNGTLSTDLVEVPVTPIPDAR